MVPKNRLWKVLKVFTRHLFSLGYDRLVGAAGESCVKAFRYSQKMQHARPHLGASTVTNT
jgi:hypothetical protein